MQDVFIVTELSRLIQKFALLHHFDFALGLMCSEFYFTNLNPNHFAAWGKNPILLYGLSYLFIGVFVLPRIPAWHTLAPLWLTGLQAAMLVVIMGALALYRQK